MPRDDDEMLPGLPPEFGSGVIGVCDVCGKRQAVIVLSRERFKLCVLDFLNKSWANSGAKPGAPLPLYRSERVWFPTDLAKGGKAPAIALSPTKVVKHPVVLLTPDIYGLTTTVLDGAIRLAREGFEVLLPDVGKTPSVTAGDHLALRVGARFRGGVPLESPRVVRLRRLYADALRYLRGREMVDPDKTGLLGVSYGASLALAVAAEDRRVGALAVAYPVPVRPPELWKLVTAPVLFVDAQGDPLSRQSRRQLEPWATSREVNVRFYDAAGARHHFLSRDLAAYDLTVAEAAWSEMVGFLRKSLLPQPPKPPTPPTVTSAPRPPAAAAPPA